MEPSELLNSANVHGMCTIAVCSATGRYYDARRWNIWSAQPAKPSFLQKTPELLIKPNRRSDSRTRSASKGDWIIHQIQLQEGRFTLEATVRVCQPGCSPSVTKEGWCKQTSVRFSFLPLTQDFHRLPVWPLAGQRAGTLQVLLAFPQPAPDGTVEEDQTQHRPEEVGGGHPDHDVQLPGADGVAGMLALARVIVGPRVVVVLHANQEERGSRGEQRKSPQGQDDVLDPAPGHHHLAPEGEADGQVALDTQRCDVENGGRGAAFKDVVIEAAHRFAEQPRHVLPQAVQVKGQAEEDDEVRHGHAGQVQVGGGFHVLEILDDEDGHGVARHANDEDEDADDCDRDEGGRGEQGALIVVLVCGLLVHRLCSGSMEVHLGSGPGHSSLLGGRVTVRSLWNLWNVTNRCCAALQVEFICIPLSYSKIL